MMSRALFSVALAVAFGCVAVAFQKPRQPAPAKAPAKTPASTPVQSPAIPSAALALMPKPATGDTLHIQTKVGSFKLVAKGESLPAGRLEFSFHGTVLISGLVPGSYLQTSGNIRKEYENVAEGKTVYFGSGKILIVGSFRNCQWFGRDLDFQFQGSAVVRVISEFDDKLKTGNFWFEPTEKNPLQVDMLTLVVPEIRNSPMPAITREEFEKMKKKGGG